MKAASILAALGCAIALSACSTPADKPDAAANTASVQTAVAATDSTAEDRVVCKNIAVTGTRIANKVCRKQSEWEQMARDARTAVDHAQQPSRRGGTNDG